jgi:flagellar FliL protein
MSFKQLAGLVLLFSLSFNLLASAGGGGGSSPYLELKPSFVVNVTDGGDVHHLQVTMQVKLEDPAAAGLLEEHSPAIRHAMVMLFSGQDVKEIRTVQGKEKLREAALHEIRKVLEETTGKPQVAALYFTGFIIQ